MVLVTLGSAISLAAILFYVFRYNPPEPVLPTKRSRFLFMDKRQWHHETRAFLKPSVHEPIVQESFLISETLDEFIGLIIQEFIDSWFQKITTNPLFQENIREELQHVFKQLTNRLTKVDLARLLVSKLVPILNDHLVDFIRAEERVQTKIHNNKGGLDTLDHEIDVARQYRRGKIHPAVTVTKTGGSDVNEKKYLRSQVASLIPFLVSEAECHNEISVSLVRELLSCTILCNVFQMVGESDFYNLLIVKLIGDNLKRRDQVKKLREALDQHTQKEKEQNEKLSKQLIITEGMDIVSYNNCLERIQSTTSLDDLKQLKLYISFQLLQTPQKDSNYVHRLKQVQSIVDTKIKQLEKNKELQLKNVLENETYLNEFSQFLKKRGKLKVLGFWLSVERIKAPLELPDDKLSLSLGFSNSDDIKEIYKTYLKDLEFIKSDFKIVEEYILSKDLIGRSQLYQKARERLFNLQDEAYYKIEDDFKEFTLTEEYQDLVAQAPGLGDSNVSPVVIKAVEEAFTQIMKNNIDGLYESRRQLLTLDLKKDLFGETSSLFSDNSSNNPSRYSKLFDDLSDESGNDSDSINMDSDTNSNQLQDSTELDGNEPMEDQSLLLAAPGNLKLTEEIDRLTEEINRLTEQQNILTPLIKKAELTNNVSEYKILKNSKLSLEREISSKELQKQQYVVQESDNSLYGKSRVSIQSYISGSDQGKEFTLYIIEVQRFLSNDPMKNTAGWIVARRFSQFYKLHEYLRTRYLEVSDLKFPKRTMFKLQQKQIVDIRKAELAEYLQKLLEIPQVCSNRAFRSFLSSENFNLSKNQSFEENLTLKGKHSNADLIASTFYQGISNRFNSRPNRLGKELPTTTPKTNEEITRNISEMEREIRSFDEKGVFVKPIVDIILTIFKLRHSKSWLRGSALLVILQQIFGTTIEKKIHELVNQFEKEENILDVLEMLKGVIFPNGKFKDPPIVRSNFEKASTRDESKFLLSVFMNENFSTIFGVSNTKYGFTVLFNALQNNFLVKHLVYEVFDEIVLEMFPEREMPV